MNNVTADMFRLALADCVMGTIHIKHWESVLSSNPPVSIPNYVFELLSFDSRSRDETRRKITL